MEPHISIITLGVSDLERAIHFYRDGLELPLRQAEGNIAFFDLRGTWLALYPRDALSADVGRDSVMLSDADRDDDAVVSRFAGFTLAHNVPSREEVDLVMNAADAVGARIVRPARETLWGGYAGYFADLDGYIWEVAWNPHFWIDAPTRQ